MTQVNYDKLAEFADLAMVEAVQRWIDQGRRPGSFLKAFISNDLFGAIAKADDNNGAHLRDWMIWFYAEAPRGCFGSPERMASWQEARRAEALNNPRRTT